MLEEKPPKLLIVEDDSDIATMLSVFFASHDVTTQIAADGKQALELVTTFAPDIIILDIILPYMDGLSVLDKLRSNAIQTPVILLTDKNSLEDRLTGFEHGADDYVSKPFSPKELWMRVQAILRRNQSVTLANENRILSVGGLSINPLTRMINLRDSTTLSLTKTEFDLLYYLADRKNEAVPHTVILEEVMGYSPNSQTKALVIHIANIRKKFDSQSVENLQLQAVPGIGYKLTETLPPETDSQTD